MKWGLAILTVLLAGSYIMSCKGMHEGYLDLSTGQEVSIQKDAVTGHILNKETGKPLYIYVDPVAEDTIYAKTGEVINGRVVNKDNKFYYDKDEKLKLGEEGAIKYKDDDYKAKVKKDGSIKIKKGDRKVIIHGDTGEIEEKD
jgi:hypothetical protein